MTRLLMALFVALGLGIVAHGSVTAQADVDCPEIATNAEAQAILAQFEGDPFGLDANSDGNACDSGVGGGPVTLASLLGTTEAPTDTGTDTSGGTTTTTTNTGMTLPDTGAGVMAGGISSMAAVLAVLAVISAAVAASVRTRRI